MKFKLLYLSFCLLLASCMVGPNFKAPESPTIDSYTEKPLPAHTVQSKTEGGKSQFLVNGLDIPNQWWQLFQSPELNQLILAGLENNAELQSATFALEKADQDLRRGIGALLWPSVDGQFTAQRQRFSGSVFGGAEGGQSTIFNLYNASVQVTYMLDIFGRNRREVEALNADVEYQNFVREGVYLTLTSNIATTVFTEASLRAQIKVTKVLIDLQQKQLDIINKQFELGGASKADVLSQQTLVDQTKTTLPPLEKSLAQTRDALSVLIGAFPSESSLPQFELSSLHLPEELPLSIPSLLVKQRPDVRAQQALLHKASAQIGMATADLLPKVTINGNYGSEANQWGDLFSAQSLVWSASSQVLQPIFHGGALIANLRASVAGYNQALANYKQTVLVAFQNVADALQAIEIDAVALQTQTQALESAKQTLDLTQQQFRLGAVDYLFLLNAQRQYQLTEINRIQALALRYSDTVALFQALGGGWWNCEDENGTQC